MRAAAASLLAVLVAFAKPAMSCVELQGIVPGGGEGLLDLTFLLSDASLGSHPLAPFDTLMDPPDLGAVSFDTQCSTNLETPIEVRVATALDTAMFSIGSLFEPNGVALDIFGDKETSDARRRCQPDEGDESGRVLMDLHLSVAILYASAYLSLTSRPECDSLLIALMEAVGCPISLVEVAEGDPEPSTDTPWGLAKAYIDETVTFLDENDGWNADGGMGGKEFNRVPFTGDFSFADFAGNEWNGYTPKNTPYQFKHVKSWQPLFESDGFGYITTQEHVTPHIGVTGRFFGFKTSEDEEAWGSRKLNRPPYWNRYGEVAREVIEASKVAADDPSKQFAIPFFDNKSNSLLPLKLVFFLQRSDSLSLLDFIEITLKSQLAMHNSILLSWREKIRHDAPRPPSVVRNELGDEVVEAYAGPTNGVQPIKASEWEPYIRTMPHSEYPSGSSCLCEAFTRAVIHWAGEDVIDPPLAFPPDELGEPILTFTSWSEVSQMCGDSRVWAGLHFEEAVPAGAELCGGDEMAISIAASIDALTAGDESAAVFDRGIGELILRPL